MPLIVQREQARMNKDWASADSLRESLSALGVTLSDKTHSWKAEDGRSGRIPTFQEVKDWVEGAPADGEGLGEGFSMAAPVNEEVERIRSLVTQREQARSAKNWAESDRLRDELKVLGVELNDKEKLWKSSSGLSGIIIGYSASGDPTDHEIKTLMLQREKARAAGDWATSDMIREELRAYQVDINDKMKVWRTAQGRSGDIPSWQSIQGVAAP
eukprot:CAMPEP_0170272754 /NCGR_PEP_ID=MMETSP0116_2-20130129/36337_1 /TAXON_ID=400756 /ORGANISM="Durinskia baltica, Strain CSIRO CS-38" /LENGTH=213 /DNA_ID=CAMNT_0010523977 /DNA_START=8 /DNA_END=646 /DNA_ORIENTATION=-